MEVTLQSIADELEISATTVSRSLRHDTTIHPETRARVNEAARRLGYKTRSRRPRRVQESVVGLQTLGLLVRHGSLEQMQYDVNLMKMMAGMMAVTDERGMHLKVQTAFGRQILSMAEDESLVPPMIRDGLCQALLVHGNHDERDLAFLAHRLPVVSVGRFYRDLPVDAAVADNTEGVFRLVEHLAKWGHRRLAWVGGHYNATFLEAREAGFMQGCRRNGIAFDAHSFFGPEIYENAQIVRGEALLAALEAGVTGFVCGNDGIALKVIETLEAAGKSVPRDVSVTGFDAESRPDPAKTRQLTSISPGFSEIGKVAARLALQRLSHPVDEPLVTIVRGQFVEGQTSAPPRNSAK